MTDPAEHPDPFPPAEPVLPPPPRKKGHPIVAWLVILGLVAVIIRHPWETRLSEGRAGESADLIQLRIAGRYAVGASAALGRDARIGLYKQLKSQDTGPLQQRLRFVALAGELAGAREALTQLHELREQLDSGKLRGDPQDVALVGVLDRLYDNYETTLYDAPSVTAEERAELTRRLGWFGELALAPPNGPDKAARDAVLAPAYRTAGLILGGFAALGAVGLFGLTGLAVFLILLFLGRLRKGITEPYPYGGVYAETFAVWMALFVGLSYAASRLPVNRLPGPPLLVEGGLMLLCWALALTWPLLRGVPWGRVRRDVGLTFGRNPALEPVLGFATYAMALPVLAVGVGLMFLLMRLQEWWYAIHPDLGKVPKPTHPIVQVMGHLDWPLLLQLLFLASVVAPLVEETMFRGFLYRHLREVTGRWGRGFSVLYSALVVSFLFAAIHPQGWVAIPALMALAFVFALMREWRGTLIPSMVAHGINNGLIMLLLYFALGG
jgi:membrane protease YdiL (CAAX protease family)